MTLSGKAKLAGIIGWPVTHSLSPVLHGHWLAEYGIDGAMVPLAAKAEDFSAIIDGVRRAGFKGVLIDKFPSGKGLPAPEDDRFWAAAVDLQMPITHHTGGGTTRMTGRGETTFPPLTNASYATASCSGVTSTVPWPMSKLAWSPSRKTQPSVQFSWSIRCR